jgi:helix-turn-helix, Psq domain/Tc5 transposase DNA-binding domain
MSTYSDQDLSSAVEDVKNGTPIRQAARLYNIPRSTLQGRLSGRNARRLISQEQQRLSTIQEQCLVDWIVRQESLGFAPTHAQVRAIAASLLETQGDYTPLGRRWATSFVRRHPSI